MRKILFLATILFVLVIGCSRQEQQMNHQLMELHAGIDASINVHGTTITFERPAAQTGREAVLAFSIEKNGKPVTKLPIMHDKPMHLIVVRRDLRYFDHLHPEQISEGKYVAPHTFISAGEYKVWIDFMNDDMQHLIDFDLKVTGNGVHTPEPDTLYELKVSFNEPERIVQGQTAKLTFMVTDNENKPVPITDKFLAAAGHLVVIDATQKEFAHSHDETIDRDNVLTFEYLPKTIGKHRAWVQFNYGGKARTAPFEFVVHKL